MAVESVADLAGFFDTDEFGVEASITIGVAATIPVNGHFMADHVVVMEGSAGGGVSSSAPVFTCAAADVDGISIGDGVVVNGASYTVVDPQPTGDGGVMILVLEEV